MHHFNCPLEMVNLEHGNVFINVEHTLEDYCANTMNIQEHYYIKVVRIEFNAKNESVAPNF